MSRTNFLYGSEIGDKNNLWELRAWQEASDYVAAVVHGREASWSMLQRLNTPEVKVAVFLLADVIRQNPPRAPSFTETEPVYGNPLSASDIRQRIITQLVTMPRYTALCRTEQGEYRIRPPYHPVPVNLAKREHLRAQSRARYYRPTVSQRDTQQPDTGQDEEVSPPAIINPPPSYDADNLPPTQPDHEEGDDWFDTFGDPKTP